MPSNPLLLTDPNNYKLIETFIETVAIPTITAGAHVSDFDTPAWTSSNTVNIYTVATKGECTVNALSTNVDVCGIIPLSTGAKHWYLEVGNLAANEHIRLFANKVDSNLNRDNAAFNALTIYLKNQGGATLNTRLGATVAGALDATDQTAYAEHSTGFDPANTRFGILITFENKVLSLTLNGITTSLTLSDTNAALLDGSGNNYLFGIHFNSPTGTAKIYEIRAW